VALVRTDVSEKGMLQLLVTANVLPSSLILSTMMMEVIHFSESSALSIATRRHIRKVDILHSHRRENLKSCIALTDWAL
jgi:hypothetical protein